MNNWIDWVVFGVFAVMSDMVIGGICQRLDATIRFHLALWVAILCATFLLACTPTEPVKPSCHYTGADGMEYVCGADTTRWVP